MRSICLSRIAKVKFQSGPMAASLIRVGNSIIMKKGLMEIRVITSEENGYFSSGVTYFWVVVKQCKDTIK